MSSIEESAIATTDSVAYFKHEVEQPHKNYAKTSRRQPITISATRFFQQMTDDTFFIISDEVLGNSPRTAFKQAEEWMAARGQTWTGNSKTLRAAVLNALQNGERIPAW